MHEARPSRIDLALRVNISSRCSFNPGADITLSEDFSAATNPSSESSTTSSSGLGGDSNANLSAASPAALTPDGPAPSTSPMAAAAAASSSDSGAAAATEAEFAHLMGTAEIEADQVPSSRTRNKFLLPYVLERVTVLQVRM